MHHIASTKHYVPKCSTELVLVHLISLSELSEHPVYLSKISLTLQSTVVILCISCLLFTRCVYTFRMKFTINCGYIKLNAFRRQTPLYQLLISNIRGYLFATSFVARLVLCTCCYWFLFLLCQGCRRGPAASCHSVIHTLWRNTIFYLISLLHLCVRFWLKVHVRFLREVSHRVTMYARISAVLFPCSCPYQQHHLFCIPDITF